MVKVQRTSVSEAVLTHKWVIDIPGTPTRLQDHSRSWKRGQKDGKPEVGKDWGKTVSSGYDRIAALMTSQCLWCLHMTFT